MPMVVEVLDFAESLAQVRRQLIYCQIRQSWRPALEAQAGQACNLSLVTGA